MLQLQFTSRLPLLRAWFAKDNADLPPWLEDIINKALDKDRELRYRRSVDCFRSARDPG